MDSDRWISANDRRAADHAGDPARHLRWFREAFPDRVEYGFFPQRHMTLQDTAPLMHSAEERIDVRSGSTSDLGFGADFYGDLARELLS